MNSYSKLFRTLFLSLGIIAVVLHCSKPKKEGNPIQFSLNTLDKKYSLEESKGKIRIIYFGFLSCPDVCPTTFQTISKSIQSMNSSERSQIEVLYVDIDPERDSLPDIQTYLDFFMKGMIPLTGSEEELKQVAKLFRASFEKIPIESEMKYTMDHTTSVYVVDREGYFVDKIPHGIPIEVFVEYLRKNLKN
jgi:protein SCO1